MSGIPNRGAVYRRRHAARIELIANQLRLDTLLQVKKEAAPGDDRWLWDDRKWIEDRNTELRAIIAETYEEPKNE